MLTRQVQDGYLDEWQRRAARYAPRASRSVVVSLSLSRRNAASESENNPDTKRSCCIKKHLHNATASLNCCPAYAGKTSFGGEIHVQQQDHPRACGKDYALIP